MIKLKHIKLFTIVLFSGFLSGEIFAQQWKIDSLVGRNTGFNGPVRAMAKLGDTLFLGGDFTKALDKRPYAWFIDSLGEGVQNFPDFNGSVLAACSDGHKGFYAAGSFTKVNGIAKTGFVHIDSLLNVVDDFKDVDLNFTWSTIDKMQVYDNKLFIAGNFTDQGKKKRSNLIAINPTNSKVYTQFPSVTGGSVVKIAKDASNGWFIGGSFTNVGDSLRNNLAYINSDGSISNWTADINFVNGSSIIWQILPTGNKVYVSGIFSSVNGTPRTGVACLNRNDGSLLSWNPKIKSTYYSDSIGKIYDIALVDNDLLLIGDFDWAGDSLRTGVARIDTATSAVSSWKISANYMSTVFSKGVLHNDKLFLGGSCDTINGQPRRFAGCVDINTGALLPWDPNVNGTTNVFYNPIQNMEYDKGQIVIGGYFTSVGGQPFSFVTRVDTITGARDLNFNPAPNDFVKRAVSTDSSLVILGGFTSVSGGMYANSFAVVDTLSNITLTLPFESGSLLLDVDMKDSLYLLGGSFNGYGIGKNYFMAIDIPKQEAVEMDLQLNNEVKDFNFHGGKLYLGGYFSNILSTIRKSVASLDYNTMTITNWNPNIQANWSGGSPTTSAIVCSGNKVIVGGSFNRVGNYQRSNIAQFDTLGNFSTTWNPSPLPGSIYSMVNNGNDLYVGGSSTGIYKCNLSNSSSIVYAAANDWIRHMNRVNNKLYVSGDFYTIKNQNRSKFACFDLTNDSLLPFNPEPSGTINVHFALNSNTIFAGGDFTNIGGGHTRNHLAAIDVTTGNLLPWNPSTDNSVNAISIWNNKLYVGGNFLTVNSSPCTNLAENDLQGNLSSSLFQTNGRVNVLSVYNNKMYVGGEFTTISGQSSYNLGIVNLSNTNIESFVNPITYGSLKDKVSALTVYNNNLFVGGNIMNVGATPVNNLISYDLSSGQLNNWFPNVDSTVNAIEAKNSRIYIGGSFNNVNNAQRTKLACVNMLTGSLINWQPFLDPNSYWYSNDVFCLKSKGDKIYVGGSFTYISGTYNQYLAEIDAFTGSKTPWNPSIDNTNYWTSTVPGVYSLLSDQNDLYFGGYYTKINTNNTALNRACLAEIKDTSFQSVPLCLVTVDTLSNHNTLVWEKPFSTDIASFKIYREDSITYNYQLVSTVPYDSLSVYNDFDTTVANPNVTSYKYKITAVSTSGKESNMADFHSTIHLTLNGSGQLTWNLYEIENLPNPVSYYRVYRDDFSTGNWQPINSTIPGGNTSWTDPNYSLFTNASYYVDIIWAINCNPTMKQNGGNGTQGAIVKSRSNVKNNKVSGIKQLVSDKQVAIFPNPASQNVTISCSAIYENGNSVELTNVLGETIVSTIMKEKIMSVNISDLKPGVYYFKINMPEGVATKKLIVE